VQDDAPGFGQIVAMRKRLLDDGLDAGVETCPPDRVRRTPANFQITTRYVSAPKSDRCLHRNQVWVLTLEPWWIERYGRKSYLGSTVAR
jgi:hypothetical protein